MSNEGAGKDMLPLSNGSKSAHSAWISQVFQELSPKLRRFAFSLGATDTEADEVVSITFESYLAFLARNPDGVRNHEAYLVTIARNSFARLRRGTPEHDSVEQDRVAPARPFHDTLVTELEHTLLGGALQRVSQEDRRILALRLLEDRTTEEVAGELGITTVNVRARLSRARRALRTEYLALYAASSVGTGCEPFVRALARFVAHGVKSPPRRLAIHLTGCVSCSEVLVELRDEVQTGYRARAMVWGPIGLVTLQQLTRGNPVPARAAELLIISRAIVALGFTLMILLGLGQLLGPPQPHAPGPSGSTAADESWAHPKTSGSEQLWLSISPETTRIPMPAPGDEVHWQLRVRNESLLSTIPVQLRVVSHDEPFGDSLRLTVASPTRTILNGVPLAALRGNGEFLEALSPGEALTLRATLWRDGTDRDPVPATDLVFDFETATATSGQPSARSSADTEARGMHPLDAFLLAITGRVGGGALAALAAALILMGLGGCLWGRTLLQRGIGSLPVENSMDTHLPQGAARHGSASNRAE
ncbi:sigma-70 family RNA polymerase sigma factor [Leucobacter chromiireducens]|uniref:sigma-70 family RNA polymerase sigma factor n=1 Tax=Leucobacter chromiireducens TaxID=283877 RepID=UPI003F806F07